MTNKTLILLFVLILSLLNIQNSFSQKKENLGENVNTEIDELGPVISQDGKVLYFIRSRFKSGKGFVQDAWYSEISGFGYCNKAKKLDLPFKHDPNTKCQVVSITSDGCTVLAAINKKDTLNNINGLYMAYRYIDGWDTPEKMNITNFENFVSNTNTWGAHLARNGKVLFLYKSISADTAFCEIYVSLLKNDTVWTEPVKVSETVNRRSGEQGNFSPFLAPDEVTLFFASDRKGGFGSADIYLCKRLDNSWLRWSEPMNLGELVNSGEWEGYFLISPDGKYGYFVSSDDAIGDNDIFRMELNPRFLPKPVVVLTGKVSDISNSELIPADITFESVNAKNQKYYAKFIPEKNKFRLVVPGGRKYKFKFSSQGYNANSGYVDYTSITGYKEIKFDVGLKVKIIVEPPEEPEVITLENVYFDFGKSEIKTESYPELDNVVHLMFDNPGIKIEISAHTDNVGSDDFNLTLSQARAESVLNYFVMNGIPIERLSAKGYGSTKPVADNSTEQGRQKNRRVEFKIIK